MKRISGCRRRPMILLAALVGLSLLARPVPVIAEVTEENVVEKVAAAKTPADHLAIAAYYRALADSSAKTVAEHERMLASLSSTPKGSGAWAGHCRNLIAAFKATQKEAETMAREHEAMAKAAGR